MDKPDLKIHKLNSRAEHSSAPELPGGRPEDPSSVRYVAVPGYAPDYAGPYAADDSIDLLALWRVLTRYRHVFLGIFLCGMLLAAGFAFLSTPIYRADLVMAPAIERRQWRSVFIDRAVWWPGLVSGS